MLTRWKVIFEFKRINDRMSNLTMSPRKRVEFITRAHGRQETAKHPIPSKHFLMRVESSIIETLRNAAIQENTSGIHMVATLRLLLCFSCLVIFLYSGDAETDGSHGR